MKLNFYILVLVIYTGGLLSVVADTPESGASFVWSENVGWITEGGTTNSIQVHFDGKIGWLTGYLWGENIGWISLGTNQGGPYDNDAQDNWGVNLSRGGKMFGYAWGENVGWIRFSHTGIDLQRGVFNGYAWGENIGWIRIKKHRFMSGLGTDVFQRSQSGIPKWWLNYHDITEGFDDGDGVSIVAEYIMGSNPNDPDSAMEIAQTSIVGNNIRFTITPTYTNRLYSLVYKRNPEQQNWDEVPGQTGIRGAGETHTLETELSGGKAIYSVRVQLLE